MAHGGAELPGEIDDLGTAVAAAAAALDFCPAGIFDPRASIEASYATYAVARNSRVDERVVHRDIARAASRSMDCPGAGTCVILEHGRITARWADFEAALCDQYSTRTGPRASLGRSWKP